MLKEINGIGLTAKQLQIVTACLKKQYIAGQMAERKLMAQEIRKELAEQALIRMAKNANKLILN